ncbi:MAG: hypothetical protein AAF845_19515 [Bacteroidota bacterium]
MYAVDSRDEVVEIDTLPLPDIGAPLPRLDATEHEARVTYYVRSSGEDRMATVTFHGLRALYFGPPNEEAFEGHPLANRGLRPWAAFEILRSSWIRSMERMNRVHRAHRPEAFEGLRHYVLAFLDSTFECVAKIASVAPAAPEPTD